MAVTCSAMLVTWTLPANRPWLGEPAATCVFVGYAPVHGAALL